MGRAIGVVWQPSFGAGEKGRHLQLHLNLTILKKAICDVTAGGSYHSGIIDKLSNPCDKVIEKNPSFLAD